MIKTGIPHTNILYLDIETATGYKSLFDAPLPLAVAWEHVATSRYKEELSDTVSIDTLYKKYAALYPEFGRIVCISMGYFENETDFKVRAFIGEDEYELLQAVSKAITQFSAKYKYLCGHNIKNFDVPYMIRRSVITGSILPTTFDIYNVKPWEVVQFIDTMDMWKSGANYLGSMTLESIAAAFGFKSPKEEMDGSKVSTYYYLPSGTDFKGIGKYCNGDVITTACIYIRMTRGDAFMKTIKVVENIV
jgi:DNA polymerase elongation subunit (family B)